MNFQQLEYIVAVDTHRHFVNAASACGVSQASLSSAISKLETEMDVIIFDRSKHPIEPTAIGKQIIAQAKLVLRNSAQLRELVLSEKEQEHGTLYIGMQPSIAPYLYPKLAATMSSDHPRIDTYVSECDATELTSKLKLAEIDVAIMQTPPELSESDFLAVELYTERYSLYTSTASALYQREWVRLDDLFDGGIRLFKDVLNNYPKLDSRLLQSQHHNSVLEMGGLYTMLNLVDLCGGYTLIPQLFEQCIAPEHRSQIKPINSGEVFRKVYLVIRKDYTRERMINILVDAIKKIIPADMIDERLKKFKIKM